jgi:hypothetical protein
MGPRVPHDRLCFLVCRANAREHELETQRGVARRLAALLGLPYAGDVSTARAPGRIGYAVPNDTLTSADAARLELRSRDDLFGGVVPHPYVATKTITHPLTGAGAVAPPGWSEEFGRRVRSAVLPGMSAYSRQDVREAALRLLPQGPVRLKLACGIGGSGQSVARDALELDAQIDALDDAEVARGGLVVEQDLAAVRTHSIGLLQLGDLTASYYGMQCTTPNRLGEPVYGGSMLTVTRGGFDALDTLAPDASVRRAVALARCYHDAALACFAGMFTSRANYDVAEGRDAQGREVAGVLEASWRMGGASGAEVAALQALVDDPALPCVRASTTEVYGPHVRVPDGATLYYQGDDEHVGPITKYAQVHHDADERRKG